MLKRNAQNLEIKMESEMEEFESLKCGQGNRRASVAGVYGLQMWCYGVLAGAMCA